MRATSRPPPTAYSWWPRRLRRSISTAAPAQASMTSVLTGTGPIRLMPHSWKERGAEPELPW